MAANDGMVRLPQTTLVVSARRAHQSSAVTDRAAMVAGNRNDRLSSPVIGGSSVYMPSVAVLALGSVMCNAGGSLQISGLDIQSAPEDSLLQTWEGTWAV